MAKVVGDTENIAGGTTGALQTDFPTSVDERLRRPAEGRDGVRGRLRRRRDRGVDEGASRRRLQRLLRSRRSTTRRRLGRRRRRHRRDVQGQPGVAGVRRSTSPRPRRRRSGRRRAASRRRTRRSRTSVYPDEITRATAARLARRRCSASTCRTCSRQRSAARSARALQGVPGLRGEPERHRRNHAADGGRRREGIRARRHERRELRPRGSRPSRRFPRRCPDIGSCAAPLAACVPRARRCSCSASGSCIRPSTRSSEASSTGRATISSGSTTTGSCSRRPDPDVDQEQLHLAARSFRPIGQRSGSSSRC